MNLYWTQLEPIEPTLDPQHINTAYQMLYSGGDIGTDERIFLSILNAVFALATQVQESSPQAQREEAARTFFLRSWSLLRPGLMFWTSPSLEIVQCLLLMSRFLQCTSNQHQTWMLLGTAVRIAQSLDLHVPSAEIDKRTHPGEWRRQELWHQCVFLER